MGETRTLPRKKATVHVSVLSTRVTEFYNMNSDMILDMTKIWDMKMKPLEALDIQIVRHKTPIKGFCQIEAGSTIKVRATDRSFFFIFLQFYAFFLFFLLVSFVNWQEIGQCKAEPSRASRISWPAASPFASHPISPANRQKNSL